MRYEPGGYRFMEQFLDPYLVIEAYDLLAANQDGCDEKGQFATSVRLNPLMSVIAMALGKQIIVRALLGLADTAAIYCHWPPMARCVKPGDDNALWLLHRDTEYNAHIKGEFVSVWIPLVPITPASGGIMICHLAGVTFGMQPGDAVLMAQDCLHTSLPNRSGSNRLSCDFRFFGGNTTSSKHHLNCWTGEVVAPC